MIIALLILIVLILLFGAGVVKGWIAHAAGYACAGIALLAALLWVGSFFGENGFVYVVFGAGGLLLLLSLWARSCMPAPEVAARAEVKDVDHVWRRFDRDIKYRFGPDAQSKVSALYQSGDAVELRKFCQEEVDRLVR